MNKENNKTEAGTMTYAEYARLSHEQGHMAESPEEFTKNVLPGYLYTRMSKRQYCGMSRDVQRDLSDMARVKDELATLMRRREELERRIDELEKRLGLGDEDRKTVGIFYTTFPPAGTARACPHCNQAGKGMKLVIRKASCSRHVARAYVECPHCHARGPYVEMVRSCENARELARLAWEKWEGGAKLNDAIVRESPKGDSPNKLIEDMKQLAEHYHDAWLSDPVEMEPMAAAEGDLHQFVARLQKLIGGDE